MNQITCQCSANIAVIKYWGKRDVSLNLPINSSLSLTFDSANISTITTVQRSPLFKYDRFYLNNDDFSNLTINDDDENDNEDSSKKLNSRLLTCISLLRQLAASQSIPKEIYEQKLRIFSKNNFPTAAGLASSASGYCCLTFAIANLFGIKGDYSAITRQGSGSACRSLYGGFVQWYKGHLPDGSDSVPSQIATEAHWDNIRMMILVVNANKKETSSTAGMQQSVATSPLIADRITVVPKRMTQMKEAILNNDFTTFATLTMTDSDHFHNICATTDPPIHYLNDTSKHIIQLIKNFNQTGVKAAYTFDAGPNAVIFTRKEHLAQLFNAVNQTFPPSNLNSWLQNTDENTSKELLASVVQDTKQINYDCTAMPDAISNVIITKVGPGPKILDPSASLV